MNYYVEADGIRSETYSLEVSEIPRVSSLQVRLVYPKYTHLEPAVQKDDGDIEALVGTTAHFRIESDQPIREALLKLEEGAPSGLKRTAPADTGVPSRSNAATTTASTSRTRRGSGTPGPTST